MLDEQQRKQRPKGSGSRGNGAGGEAIGKAIQGFLRAQNCWDAGEGQMLWALLSVSSPLLLFSC